MVIHRQISGCLPAAIRDFQGGRVLAGIVTVLQLVSTDHQTPQTRSLQVARAHIDSAIAHIDNAAQARAQSQQPARYSVEDLRLLTTALANIRDALAIIDRAQG